MKLIAAPLIALICVHAWSCTTVTTKTTYPDGRIEEKTVKGIDPSAPVLVDSAAGIINHSAK